VVDPAHPLDRRPNTWVIRYGDAEWKQFLDFWCTYLVVNGEIDKLFKHHMGKLGAA
jgi:polar amino acid transport system substrate-binding protein